MSRMGTCPASLMFVSLGLILLPLPSTGPADWEWALLTGIVPFGFKLCPVNRQPQQELRGRGGLGQDIFFPRFLYWGQLSLNPKLNHRSLLLLNHRTLSLGPSKHSPLEERHRNGMFPLWWILHYAFDLGGLFACIPLPVQRLYMELSVQSLSSWDPDQHSIQGWVDWLSKDKRNAKWLYAWKPSYGSEMLEYKGPRDGRRESRRNPKGLFCLHLQRSTWQWHGEWTLKKRERETRSSSCNFPVVSAASSEHRCGSRFYQVTSATGILEHDPFPLVLQPAIASFRLSYHPIFGSQKLHHLSNQCPVVNFLLYKYLKDFLFFWLDPDKYKQGKADPLARKAQARRWRVVVTCAKEASLLARTAIFPPAGRLLLSFMKGGTMQCSYVDSRAGYLG